MCPATGVFLAYSSESAIRHFIAQETVLRAFAFSALTCLFSSGLADGQQDLLNLGKTPAESCLGDITAETAPEAARFAVD